MKLYDDDVELHLEASVGLTIYAKLLVEKEKKRLLEKEGRKLSRSKIVNNLILKEYGENK